MNMMGCEAAEPKHPIRLARAVRCATALPVMVIALLTLVTAGASAAEKRLALVVGNSAYRSIAKLNNPRDDAKLIADTLRGIGFTLVGGQAQIDLDKARLDDALRSFGDELAQTDVALFYYAGHGVRIGASNYLVPVDANPASESDADAQLVDITRVLRQMEGAGTRLNLVMLDACRSNPFGAPGLRASGGGLAPMRAPERTLISYATEPGALAQDGNDGHSPYTKALAEAMPRAGLDVLQTFNEAGLAVRRATGGQQQPWLSSSPVDAGFHFVATPSASARAASSPADDPAQAWSEIRSTTDPAVLEAFVQRYGTSFHASLAKTRLDDLKAAAAKIAAAKAPPLPAGAPSSPSAASSAAAAESGSVHAILYDEDLSEPKGVQHAGTVAWRTDTVKAAGKPDEVVIRADVDVPARQLKMSMTLARNTDPALPASHTAQLTFQLAKDSFGGGVTNVPGMLMKTRETARGTPLAGLAVKVADGIFLVGLSNVAADRARNLQMLLEQSWFDIPMVYANQRRGILAIDKGTTGSAAFQAAFAAWGQTKQVTLPPQNQ